MNPELAQALASTALLGTIVRPLLVVVLLVGFWFALAGTHRTVGQRFLSWSIVALVLIAWLGTVWTLSFRGIFESLSGAGWAGAGGLILLPIVLFSAVALAILTRSSTIAQAIDAAPLWWLVAFQGYRIAGFIFLRLWAGGYVPGYFGLPSGIGDTLTGAFAIGAAIALWRHFPRARTLAYAVNIFGIADLVNAVSMGLLSTVNAGAGSPLLMYPLSIVPTFGVPLAFIVHCLSLWQLRRRFRSSSGIPRAGTVAHRAA